MKSSSLDRDVGMKTGMGVVWINSWRKLVKIWYIKEFKANKVPYVCCISLFLFFVSLVFILEDLYTKLVGKLRAPPELL